ncbi:hypothetical protein [Bacillus sp. DX3.1]|uniref:hypothetical protein n=1 Tax=Bacillus sp. DX3.1 TaxID=3052091 RepID=UPI0025705CC8|nr:hypothetical protein [Bacillus sp. DX3.1]WJE82185.1 hypothetical protein QRE67_02400 [Bacillus sp. DX3.1]
MLPNILESFKNLEPKDQITFIGLVLTSVISLLTLINTIRINSKSAYLNSVTKERIESMTELKEQVAKYLSLIRRYQILELNTEEKASFLQELEYRKFKINFQLNEEKTNELEISSTLNHINALIVVTERVEGPVSIRDLKQSLVKEAFPIIHADFEQEESTIINALEQKNILKSFLDNRLSNLKVSLKKHVKTEWEKIKKESKKF